MQFASIIRCLHQARPTRWLDSLGYPLSLFNSPLYIPNITPFLIVYTKRKTRKKKKGKKEQNRAKQSRAKHRYFASQSSCVRAHCGTMNVGAAPSAASPSHEMVSRGPTVGNLGMAEASRMSSNPPSGIHHTAGSAPLRSGEGASTSSLTKDISISTGSEALAQQTGHSSSTPIAAETKRRVMPVRLRRVSTLLAGSKLEDDLPGSSSKLGEWGDGLGKGRRTSVAD